MRSVVLRIINHVRFRIRDEAEATRPFGFRILHNDDIYDLPPFFEMRLERFVGGSVVETTDKDFPMYLGLILKVGRGINKMADGVIMQEFPYIFTLNIVRKQ